MKLVCLDDDNQGRALEVLWELELGAKVHQPEAHGLGDLPRVDPPRHFAAYLHALKWDCATATDAKLFRTLAPDAVARAARHRILVKTAGLDPFLQNRRMM